MTPGAIKGFHPYADKFPLMGDVELGELATDIAQNGLLNPITVDKEGLILDGRCRYMACQQAGVEPSFVEYDGGDLAGYVIGQNVHRRHMSTGALAMATALVLQAAGKRKDGRWVYGSLRDSTDLSNSFAARLRQCGVILDHTPSFAEYVVNDAMSLDQVYRTANCVRLAECNKPDDGESRARFEEAHHAMMAHDEQGRVLEAEYAQALAAYFENGRKIRVHEKAEAGITLKDPPKYNLLAKAIFIIAHGRDDSASMGDFDPDDPANLDPPGLARYFEIDELTAARRSIEKLIDWRRRCDNRERGDPQLFDPDGGE
jgi:hypothetical protein